MKPTLEHTDHLAEMRLDEFKQEIVNFDHTWNIKLGPPVMHVNLLGIMLMDHAYDKAQIIMDLFPDSINVPAIDKDGKGLCLYDLMSSTMNYQGFELLIKNDKNYDKTFRTTNDEKIHDILSRNGYQLDF